jgi:hypothetical protein
MELLTDTIPHLMLAQHPTRFLDSGRPDTFRAAQHRRILLSWPKVSLETDPMCMFRGGHVDISRHIARPQSCSHGGTRGLPESPRQITSEMD